MGRPPGSKSKAKLEAKWAAQGIPKSPSPSSPNNPTSDNQLSHTIKSSTKAPLVLDFNKKISNKVFSSTNENNDKTTVNKETTPG